MINGHISSNRHCSVYLFVCSFTQNEKSNHQKSRNNEKKDGGSEISYLFTRAFKSGTRQKGGRETELQNNS